MAPVLLKALWRPLGNIMWWRGAVLLSCRGEATQGLGRQRLGGTDWHAHAACASQGLAI